MERFFKILAVTVVALAGAVFSASGQIVSDNVGNVDSDSIRQAFDKGPYFGLYKDNYFIFGPAIGQRITKENTNIKFQISIAKRLTRSTLPLGTYLFL
ncbi:MAG: phospholipase, partial [Duncaniella sp.]|nr:phospholipase [Duncaniella sp.]